MKLTQKAIDKLKESRELRLKLALELSFTELWINKLIDKNDSNGPLTTVTSIGILRDNGGMKESEILEKSDSVAA